MQVKPANGNAASHAAEPAASHAAIPGPLQMHAATLHALYHAPRYVSGLHKHHRTLPICLRSAWDDAARCTRRLSVNENKKTSDALRLRKRAL